MSEWLLEGPNGPLSVTAPTPDEAVEKYGIFYQLESYELTDVEVLGLAAPEPV